MVFIRVVLPAPLGPMRPTISPGRTSIAAPLSAAMPPKWTATSSTTSGNVSGDRCGRRAAALPLPSSCSPMVAKLTPAAARSIAVPGAGDNDHGPGEGAFGQQCPCCSRP